MCAKTQRIGLLHTEISKYFNKEGKIKAAANSGFIDNFMTFSKEFIEYVFRLFFIENEGFENSCIKNIGCCSLSSMVISNANIMVIRA